MVLTLWFNGSENTHRGWPRHKLQCRVNAERHPPAFGGRLAIIYVLKWVVQRFQVDCNLVSESFRFGVVG